MIERILIGLILMIAPVGLLVWHMRKMLAEEKATSRAPFTEKLLRPPGEGLRLRISELEEKALDVILALISLLVFPGFFVLLVIVVIPLPAALVAYSAIAGISFTLAFKQWHKLCALRKNVMNYRLGFDGERYIASELEPLIASGYHVFHDFVFDGKPGGEKTTFNIDHIVIGPAGIFSIETKTRRKKNDTSNHITINGDTLEFSTGARDRESIPQARRTAKDLGNWLTPKGSSAIEVKPVLAIPGWSIKGMGEGEVPVYSGKSIAKYLVHLQTRTPLSPEEVAGITNQIENHCRNIDSA